MANKTGIKNGMAIGDSMENMPIIDPPAGFKDKPDLIVDKPGDMEDMPRIVVDPVRRQPRAPYTRTGGGIYGKSGTAVQRLYKTY